MTGIGGSSKRSAGNSPGAMISGRRPRSTAVEMYSRPWMPSRVGRTISDMSSQMASNPVPANGPPYPAPEMGIFPRSALNPAWGMISGVESGRGRARAPHPRRGEVPLHIQFQDGLQDLVGRQGVLVGLSRPQFRGRRAREEFLREGLAPPVAP